MAAALVLAPHACAAAGSDFTRLSVGGMSFSARLEFPGRSLAVRWRGESYYAAPNTSSTMPLPSPRLTSVSDGGETSSWTPWADDQYSALSRYAEVLEARALSRREEATAPQLEKASPSRRGD